MSSTDLVVEIKRLYANLKLQPQASVDGNLATLSIDYVLSYFETHHRVMEVVGHGSGVMEVVVHDCNRRWR